MSAHRESARLRKKEASAATPESNFAYRWLNEHQPAQSASQEQLEQWTQLFDALRCDEIVGNALSQKLHAEWLEEEKRQRHSEVEAELAAAAAVKKEQEKEARLAKQRADSAGRRKQLSARNGGSAFFGQLVR